MKFKFKAKYVDLLAKFMAKQDIRYYLNGIRIEPAPAGHQGVIIAATNGHAMVLVHDAFGEIVDFDAKVHTGSVKLPPGAIAAAKKSKKDEGLVVAFNGTHLSVGLDYLNPSTPSECDLYICPSNPIIVGNFPQFNRLLPEFKRLKRGGVVGSQSGVNPEYLSKFTPSAGSRFGGITLWHDPLGNESTTYVQVEDMPEVLGIVMSMRASADMCYEKQREVWECARPKTPATTGGVKP